jgi:hypothetical protein
MDPKRKLTSYSRKLIAGFMSANPRLAQSVMPRRTQIKRALRNYGTDTVFVLEDPELQAHVQVVGAKWAYAFHYAEIGRPLPPTGAVWVKWWSNSNRLDGPILPSSFEAILPREARTLHQGKLTSVGQFEYASLKALDSEMVVSFLTCGFSFAMLMVSAAESTFFASAESMGSVIHRPGHLYPIPKSLHSGPLTLKKVWPTEPMAV